MNRPETLATLGTQDTGKDKQNKKHNTTQKTKEEQQEAHYKPRLKACACVQ